MTPVSSPGRILPAEVKAAYRETGLMPVQGQWYSYPAVAREEVGMACGIGVVAVHRTFLSTERAFTSFELRDYLGLSEPYLEAYLMGFDGHWASWEAVKADVGEILPATLAEYRQGFFDGEAARKAVFLTGGLR